MSMKNATKHINEIINKTTIPIVGSLDANISKSNIEWIKKDIDIIIKIISIIIPTQLLAMLSITELKLSENMFETKTFP